MRGHAQSLLLGTLLQSTLWLSASAAEPEHNRSTAPPVYDTATDRLIVGWSKSRKSSTAERNQKVSSLSELKPGSRESLDDYTDLVHLRDRAAGNDLEIIMNKL
ncbi:MAG: hypothetical protein ACJ8OJ_03780, partial [Povalibacter sp.]